MAILTKYFHLIIIFYSDLFGSKLLSVILPTGVANLREKRAIGAIEVDERSVQACGEVIIQVDQLCSCLIVRF